MLPISQHSFFLDVIQKMFMGYTNDIAVFKNAKIAKRGEKDMIPPKTKPAKNETYRVSRP